MKTTKRLESDLNALNALNALASQIKFHTLTRQARPALGDAQCDWTTFSDSEAKTHQITNNTRRTPSSQHSAYPAYLKICLVPPQSGSNLVVQLLAKGSPSNTRTSGATRSLQSKAYHVLQVLHLFDSISPYQNILWLHRSQVFLRTSPL